MPVVCCPDLCGNEIQCVILYCVKKAFKLLFGNSDEWSADHSQARGYSLRCALTFVCHCCSVHLMERCAGPTAQPLLTPVWLMYFLKLGDWIPGCSCRSQCTSVVLLQSSIPLFTPAFGPLLFFEQSSSLLSLVCSSCLHYPLILLHDQKVF